MLSGDGWLLLFTEACANWWQPFLHDSNLSQRRTCPPFPSWSPRPPNAPATDNGHYAEEKRADAAPTDDGSDECVTTETRRHLWRGVLVRDACKYHVVDETAEQQKETRDDKETWPGSFHIMMSLTFRIIPAAKGSPRHELRLLLSERI